MRNILKDHSNVIPVMIHGGDTAEPMGTIGGDQLISSLDVWFPSATIDRFKYPGNENIVNVDTIWDDLILSRQDDNTYNQVDIEKSYDPNSRELEITLIIKFTKAQKGNFRLNAYLTENNLIFDQENCLNEDPEYPDLFGRGDPIVGYVHDFVLRDMLGGTYGIIPDGASAIPLNVLAGQTYSIHHFVPRMIASLTKRGHVVQSHQL